VRKASKQSVQARVNNEENNNKKQSKENDNAQK